MKKLYTITLMLIVFLLTSEAVSAGELMYMIANSIIKKRNLDDIKTAEKLIIIKGLYVGMDGNECKLKLEKLLGKDWIITNIGKSNIILADLVSCDPDVFGDTGSSSVSSESIPTSKFYTCPREYGFAIVNLYNMYSGFVSIDSTNGKVIRLSFSGRIIDYIYSSSKVDGHEFYEQFRKAYNLPDMYWIPRGWVYSSPLGYTVTLKTNKFLDINHDIIEDTTDKNTNGPQINFNE